MRFHIGSRTRKLLGLGACFGLVATFSMTAFTNGVSLTDGASLPRMAAANNLLALMEARSPGARTAGALIKTKPRKAARQARAAPRAAPAVIQQALGAPAVAAVAPPVLFLPDAPVEVASVAGLPPLIETLPGSGGGTFFIPPPSGGGGGVITPPGGGGGGGGTIPPPGGGGGTIPPPGGGGETPPPVITPPVVPVVPEPATWLQMIIGFGAIGMTLRRRRTRDGLPAGLSAAKARVPGPRPRTT